MSKFQMSEYQKMPKTECQLVRNSDSLVAISTEHNQFGLIYSYRPARIQTFRIWNWDMCPNTKHLATEQK